MNTYADTVDRFSARIDRSMRLRRFLIPALLSLACPQAHAQLVIVDNMTGSYSSYQWRPIKGACLTAGSSATASSIPPCVGLPYYTSTLVGGHTGRLPDPVGYGALRLTNGDERLAGVAGDNQSGAVVSNFTFPTNKGLRVTFSTMTYGGDGYSNWGADGMSFFLSDGSRPPSIGADGSSLGYACNNDADHGWNNGVDSGYIGIGIDEHGNFANKVFTASTGTNSFAHSISVRGAGNTNWNMLAGLGAFFYNQGQTDSRKIQDVAYSCSTGKTKIAAKTLQYNYNLLSTVRIPAGPISNQQATAPSLRSAAIPITYDLRLSEAGVLDFYFSYNGGTPTAVISGMDIKAVNGPIPSSFRFGFAASTGQGSNIHEITCFKAGPGTVAFSSAATNIQQGERVEAGTQVYLANYHQDNSWGQLTAQDLIYDPVTDRVSIRAIANWDASCVLTGGACAPTGSSNTAQAPATRTMLTWNGNSGIPFQWANLSAAQRTLLSAGLPAGSPDMRLKYLRGERSAEKAQGGILRTRTGVFGDVIGSSPTLSGQAASPYAGTWSDALYPAAVMPEANYEAFKASKAGRQNVVFVGANDGFVHGFRAGSNDASGVFTDDAATPNDGKEVLAYMPAAALNTIQSATPALSYSDPLYSHNYFVDAQPVVADLFYSGSWHTWLIGGLGLGGNPNGIPAPGSAFLGSMYALDITDPSRFIESQASSLVIGDWSSASASFTCVNAPACGSDFGRFVGTPVVRRLHDGSWGVLFGNGLDSVNGVAGLFVMHVSSTGSTSLRFISTNSGNAVKRNGIASVSPIDLDGDQVADFVYGGDSSGNLWRFDLTSDRPADWSVTRVFTTAVGQPITGKVAAAVIKGEGGTGKPRLMVAFGTGEKFPQTGAAGAIYSSGQQALYGVWDWNMDDWNAKAAASARLESLMAPRAIRPEDLQPQTITVEVPATETELSYRTASLNRICWQGTTLCSGANESYGWKLDLPGAKEQAVYDAVVAHGTFLINTTLPANNSPLTCTETPESGYTMALALATGGATSSPFFDDSGTSYEGVVTSGKKLGATGSPSIVSANKKLYLIQQTTKGTGSSTRVLIAGSTMAKRLTWAQLR